MSRTFRHMKSSKYRIKDYWKYTDILDKKSDEAKKLKAQFHGNSHSIMIWSGPMWWLRMSSQKPYMIRAKKEIHKFLRDPDYEVIIENKPHRDYWW